LKKSFTLIEVLAAALIVAVTFAGLIASFNASRVYIIRSSKRLLAANLARSKLNELNSEVRADTWEDPDNMLAPTGPSVSHSFGGGDYQGTYIVETVNVGGDEGYRKVTMTINYPEQ